MTIRRRDAGPRSRARLATTLTLGGLLAFLASPATVLADCMPPPPIDVAVETAEIVFVGTVLETSNRNTWATVEVEEVWRGPDLQRIVLVRGGPAGNAATSVDRSFEIEQKYLFFPYVDDGGEPRPGEGGAGDPGGLADNSCTSTTRWAPEFEVLRPDDARPPLGTSPESPGFDTMSIVVPGAVAALVAVLLLGIGLLARGRETN